MQEYSPDNWVVFKFKNNDTIQYRLLVGWAGSYLYGSAWRINSGITRVEKDGEYIRFYSKSGTCYICNSNRYGLGSSTCGIWESLCDSYKNNITIMDENTNWENLTLIEKNG